MIKWLEEATEDRIEKFGRKAVSLANLRRENFPVPPAFVITTDAFWTFFNPLKEKIDGLLGEKNASEKIKNLINTTILPGTLVDEVNKYYNRLTVDREIESNINAVQLISSGRGGPLVSVRPSPFCEKELSFAGQHDSFENVRGASSVLNHIKRVWSSLFNKRAIEYRRIHDISWEDVSLPVIVQKMIQPEKSGLICSFADHYLIEAVWGSSISILHGFIHPDIYEVNKDSFDIMKRTVNKQEWQIARDRMSGRTVKQYLSEEKVDRRKLTDEEIRKLASIFKNVESSLGGPQIMKWVYSGSFFIVQSRPHKFEREQIKIEKEPILSGICASPGVAEGSVLILEDWERLEPFGNNIVLLEELSPSLTLGLDKAKGFICKYGGYTSNGAIILREQGIPGIIADYSNLKEGFFVTLDGTSGKVYRGAREAEEPLLPVAVPLPEPRLGTIIETPAMALSIENYIERIGFVNIALEKLARHTLASEYDVDLIHPAVLKEIEHVVSVCRSRGVKTNVYLESFSQEVVDKLKEIGVDYISIVGLKEVEETKEETLAEPYEDIEKEESEGDFIPFP